MSRIRGLEPKVKREILPSVKKKNEPDTACDKDDVEKYQVKELLAKIPALAKNFKIHRKIGEGTFSTVYLASRIKQEAELPDEKERWYAVKHLRPTPHPTRVEHELHCLRDIGGSEHVIGVTWCLRNLDNVAFIMPHMPHKKFTEYVLEMDAEELRRYMRALLTALRHVHTFDVIHRDVKPSNFLYDRERRRYALVDFGLAQHTAPSAPAQPPPAHQAPKRAHNDESLYPPAKRVALDLTMRTRASGPPPNPNRQAPGSPHPADSNPARAACVCAGLGGVCTECAQWAAPRANRAGTQGFRPPEVLLKYPHQTTAVDMWAAGVVLASVLAGRYPFFRAEDDMSAIGELASFLGTAALEQTATALGRRLKMSTQRRPICLRKMAALLHGECSVAVRLTQHSDPKCDECKLPRQLCICRDLATQPQEFEAGRTIAGFPDSAFALAARLLEPNPGARITAAEALRHPFFRQH